MTRIPQPDDLTLDQRVGQVLCFGWQGRDDAESRAACAHAREIVAGMGVGGLVLLGRNVGRPEETRSLVDALQALSEIPLLVAVDQEGGMVCRIPAPLHSFPGNMALGACGADAEDLAEQQAGAVGRELRALGVNWNFAPCVDVNSCPDNPIIGVRSYGEDPELVARLGAASVRGFQGAGVMACPKHFPGHGDTEVDSHLDLPVVRRGLGELERVELRPFRAAIGAGAASLMTTHILFPALDPERPATLSAAVLTSTLRQRLGFAGLVVTDCLEMRAIAGGVGTARGAVEAIKAGADMVLVCHTLETQRATVRALKEAVQSGELPESRLNEAAGRVLAAKQRFAVGSSAGRSQPWLAPEHDALEKRIALQSITLVRNAGAIPIPPGARAVVASIHPSGQRLAAALGRHAVSVEWLPLSGVAKASDREAAVAAAREASNSGGVLVFATAPKEPWTDFPLDPAWQAACVGACHEAAGDSLIVAALREPYDIRAFPQAANYVCSYGHRDCSLEALAAVLAGMSPAAGRLPVSIPGVTG